MSKNDFPELTLEDKEEQYHMTDRTLLQAREGLVGLGECAPHYNQRAKKLWTALLRLSTDIQESARALKKKRLVRIRR